jgi:hypothetical protein
VLGNGPAWFGGKLRGKGPAGTSPRSSPCTFLALSQPREALGTVAAARTDCESITAAVGSALRPPARRTWARNASCKAIVAPVAFHRW